MKNLRDKIAAYERAGEEVRNAAIIEFIEKKSDVSVETARELMDRLQEAECNGGRAERKILEAMAITVARTKIIQ